MTKNLKNTISTLSEEIEQVKMKMTEDFEKTVTERMEKVKKEMTEDLKKMVIEVMEKVKMDMIEKLEEKHCELQCLEDTNAVLYIKDIQSNCEIHEARKELVKFLRGLRDLAGGGSCKIGLKRLGELDEKLFTKACKERFSVKEEAEVKHSMLCSEWRDNLKDPSWHPFNIGDNLKAVVDEEDEKLRNLKKEWGEEVMNAVKTALDEVNPSGRYKALVAWNYEQGRQATLGEGIAYMANQINTLIRFSIEFSPK